MALQPAAALARVRALWLSARPAWAVGETLVIAAVIVSGPLLYLTTHSGEGWLRLAPTIVLLAGPVCALWCALRLRLERGPWWRGTLIDGAIGGAVGLVPTAIIVLTIYFLTLRTGIVPRVMAPRLFSLALNRFSLSVFALIWLLAFSLGFITLRLIVRLLLYWDRLRRTSLQWSLTHAHLMIVVIGGGLVAALALATTTVLGAHNVVDLTYVALALLMFLTVLTAVAIVVVLIPSAIFSYLFVRPTTRRIRALAEATGALRAGDLSIRVPVTGEDEVAQLQANFNAMAADLERAVGELQAERDNVATLLRARRELVASVSHELRTPVATLRSYLESTLLHWDANPPETLRHDLGVMERETIQLQALINDLFTLARAEVGRLDLRLAPVDLAATARQVVEAMAPLAWQSRRVEVVVDPIPHPPPLQGEGEPEADSSLQRLPLRGEGEAEAPLLVEEGLGRGSLWALADAGRIQQIVQNLLHNAVRHTPPGGIVAVAASAPDEYTVGLCVRDTGEGIVPADLPHIWERFYRARGANQGGGQESGGTGLGLTLVKELTEAMGGSVGVASAPGEGSSFTVRLPRAPRTDARSGVSTRELIAS